MPRITEASATSSIEFICPNEAIARLTKVSQEIKTHLSAKTISDGHQHLASVAYCLALDTHVDFLSRVNDEEFFTPVAWDTRTNLPSHPSMSADIASAAKDAGPLLRGVLKSFFQWTPLFRENIDCACGSDSKFVKVSWCIMLNHAMSEVDGELVVKQFLAAVPDKPEYMEKLKAHHQPNKISQADGRFVIILECNNTISNHGGISIKLTDFWASNLVNVENLRNLFNSSLNKMKEVGA